MKDKWFVYAILCGNGSVYIGQTNDLLHRWELHKKGKGAQWTKKCPPLRLFYFEEVDSQANALHRERELKKTTGRRMLKGLLQRACLSAYMADSQAGEPAEKLLERIPVCVRTRTGRKEEKAKPACAAKRSGAAGRREGEGKANKRSRGKPNQTCLPKPRRRQVELI